MPAAGPRVPVDDAQRRRAWAKHGLSPPPPGTLAVGPYNNTSSGAGPKSERELGVCTFSFVNTPILRFVSPHNALPTTTDPLFPDRDLTKARSPWRRGPTGP